ncbi:MAG: beta-propeller fold lactonase family protein [Planctomycetes bacterium]|nr:beta-propeller fold lactonase family protein [Planctomycetota bacterium]
MSQLRFSVGILGLAALLLAGCGGSSKSSSGIGGGAGSMDLVYVSNGFGQLLPHQVFKLDSSGQPTANVLSIRSADDLLGNVSNLNPILPTPSFAPTAQLPSGADGNQFLVARFTQPVGIDTVLSNLPGSTQANNLTGTITVLAIDPNTGASTTLSGRAFVGGQTYGKTAVGSPPTLPLQSWVELDANGNMVAVTQDDTTTPGLGFPGTEGHFAGQNDLLDPEAFVFVADSDGDLTTHEAFPQNVEIRMRITTGVKNVQGRALARQAVASTTVGSDTIGPEVLISLPPSNSPYITPGGGQSDVDPLTTIRVEFSEPVQPFTVGDLPLGLAPNLSASISVQFGPATSRVSVPFTAMPVSVYDLTTYELTPAFNFPGEGPDLLQCGVFNRVDVAVNATKVQDLAGNLNALPATTFFLTGEGPGLINAPVAPDAVYVGSFGAHPGVSVIDLNGFGQGTGDPTFDPAAINFQEGWTVFPYNPNVKLQGTIIRPALTVGSCTVDGGSSGVFTLSRDSSLNDQLVRTPVILKADDMMLGHALDSAFNNGPAPFGCQAGGGNLCAQNGRKQFQVMVGGPNTLIPAVPQVLNNQILNTQLGAENTISFAPHPNPPPLQFPPLCVSPYIGGQEPTSIFTVLPPPPAQPPPGYINGLGLQNLLVPGDPFGDPANSVPPSGLLSPEQNAWFQGPHAPQDLPSACTNFLIRQQVGQFLYLADRARNEIVVFNSNSMAVIERIEVPDPTSLAMSPNLDFLAVTNQSVGLVSFIDINPSSSTFHQLVKNTVVGAGPRGIAWESGNEDILVCNEQANSMSIISAFSLDVRKEIISQLNQPFEVVTTPRQNGFGFQRGVYFAYILNRSGSLAMFESGPNAVNGWGYDDVIGTAPQTFQNPKTLQPDLVNINSAVWIVHEGPISPETNQAGASGVPAVTNLKINSGIFGQLPLNVQSLLIPQFRDLSLAVTVSLSTEALSGVPVDLAFDNQRNFGGLVNFSTVFSAGVALPINGKSLVRTAGTIQNTCEPKYMFVAVPNPTFGSDGVVDVIDISGGFNRVDTNAHRPGVQSIEVSEAFIMMDYFRQ